MEEEKQKKETRIRKIEEAMNAPDFWSDKNRAQAVIKELQELKATVSGGSVYDGGDAVLTIFSGAGGDDAEDFSSMLFSMYRKYFEKKGWSCRVLHENQNDHGGFRNITVEVSGKNSYGTLKNESGVHRLVRVSPFNAQQKRHTSFSMVEVIPKFEKTNEGDIIIPEKELEISIAKSGGPGGQNVNKVETAVRMTHIPTGLVIASQESRSQQKNREHALDILRAKLFEVKREAEAKKIGATRREQIGTADRSEKIRTYNFPQDRVTDHRIKESWHNIESIMAGNIENIIEAFNT